MKKAFTVTGKNVKVSAKFVESGVKFPNSNSNMLHNQFVITAQTESGKATFLFYDSFANFQAGKTELSESDLKNTLYCFFSDAIAAFESRNVENFCSEFGYDLKTGAKIFKECQRQLERANKLGLDIFEAANELND